MSTKTRTKKPSLAKAAARASKKPAGNGKKAPRPEITYLRTASIPLALIDPSPFQPRLEIDPDDLDLLARAVDTAGFLDAVWLREKGDRYELLDGERRWRAAEIAKLAKIRADIFAATDAQARQMALLSVVHRADISPIERATAYQAMLDQGDYPDQKALAAAMGVDQSTVSNLVRLLKLPEPWRRRIIAREISERHARALLPFIKFPTIVAAFDEFFVQNLDVSGAPGTPGRGTLPAVAEWEEETVPQIVHDCTRQMDGMHGDRMIWHPRYGRVSIFEPDAFQEKQLKIVKLGSGDQTEHLATNVELWEELQKAHLEKEMERGRKAEASSRASDQEASPDREGAAATAEDDDADRPDEDGEEECESLTPVYREALANKLRQVIKRWREDSDEEIELTAGDWQVCRDVEAMGAGCLTNLLARETALDLVERYWQAPADTDASGDSGSAEELGPGPPDPTRPPATKGSEFYRWKLAWTRKLIAEALTRCEFSQVVKLLALGLGVWKIPAEAVNQVFDEALRGNIDYSRRKSVTVNLLSANDIQLEQVIGEVVASWFWTDKEGPTGDVPPEDCEEVAAFLEIDLAAEWQGGNILAPRVLLDLYDDEGLRALGKKWKVQLGDDWNRKGIIARLEQAISSPGDKDASFLHMTLPPEVAKAKR